MIEPKFEVWRFKIVVRVGFIMVLVQETWGLEHPFQNLEPTFVQSSLVPQSKSQFFLSEDC